MRSFAAGAFSKERFAPLLLGPRVRTFDAAHFIGAVKRARLGGDVKTTAKMAYVLFRKMKTADT
jgi:hypothetical protein